MSVIKRVISYFRCFVRVESLEFVFFVPREKLMIQM